MYVAIQPSGAWQPLRPPSFGGADGTRRLQALTGQRLQGLSFLQVTYVSLSVQFTKNHVCKAYLAAKRVQSSHGIQNLASNSEKDYTVAFGEIILAARLELALLKQLSALLSFPHRNCKSLNGIAQSFLTPWKL